MDIKISKTLGHFSLYTEYTREEVHKAFGDGTKYVPGAGIWGRYGAVHPKILDDAYILFCVIKPDAPGVRLQYIGLNGEFHWVSQPSMYYGEKKLSKMALASEGSSKILLFAKPMAGPKYMYLGRLTYIGTDENCAKPTIVTWKMLSWPVPENVLKKFGVK